MSSDDTLGLFTKMKAIGVLVFTVILRIVWAMEHWYSTKG